MESLIERVSQWCAAVQTWRQAGQGLVEYALIVVLISIVSIAVMQLLGSSISSVFSSANVAL